MATYSRKQKARFLEVLKETGKSGIAAKAAGFSLSGIYAHRQKHAPFRKAWAQVLDERQVMKLEAAEDALYERGVNGWLEKVYHKGKVVGTQRRYCGTSLMRWLAAHKPSLYGDATRIEHTGEIGTQATLVLLPVLQASGAALGEGATIDVEASSEPA